MAPEKPTLTIVRSPAAIEELYEIWQWNAEHFGPSHADNYLQYLKDRIGNLADNYLSGRSVITRPELRYVLIRRRSKGHGHIVVYSFDEQEIHILHVFHSAQDWQNKLSEELP